jgi:hypothetical protein
VIRYTRPEGIGEIQRFVVAGGDRMIRSTSGDMTVCMRAHGPVSFAEDGTRIGPLGQESWVVIGSRDAQRTVEMVVTQGASGLSYLWYVNGTLRPMSSEGTEWRDAVVPVVASLWQLVELDPQRERLAEREAVLRDSRELRALNEAERARLEAAAAEMRQVERQREVVQRDAARQLEQARAAAPAAELERLRAQLEELAERLRQSGTGSAQADTLRSLLERTQRQAAAQALAAESIAREQRVQVEVLQRERAARDADLSAAQERVRELVEVERALAERAARAAADVEVNQRELQDLMRRLQEVMRRIP